VAGTSTVTDGGLTMSSLDRVVVHPVVSQLRCEVVADDAEAAVEGGGFLLGVERVHRGFAAQAVGFQEVGFDLGGEGGGGVEGRRGGDRGGWVGAGGSVAGGGDVVSTTVASTTVVAGAASSLEQPAASSATTPSAPTAEASTFPARDIAESYSLRIITSVGDQPPERKVPGGAPWSTGSVPPDARQVRLMARRHRVDERPVLVVAAIAGIVAAFSDASPTGNAR
jgi:hypothetical protein